MLRVRTALIALLLPITVRAAPPAAIDLEEVPSSLRPLVARADAAMQALQRKLATRLMDALKQGGPAAAVAACHDEAARLTGDAADASSVALGRTSDRLRNSRNAPPAWAAAHVAAGAGKKAAEVRPVVVDLGDRIGVLRPIAVAPQCTRCHGSPESISPDVRRALAAAYPDDRAVGYAEGDHRGFMWAVVRK